MSKDHKTATQHSKRLNQILVYLIQNKLQASYNIHPPLAFKLYLHEHQLILLTIRLQPSQFLKTNSLTNLHNNLLHRTGYRKQLSVKWLRKFIVSPNLQTFIYLKKFINHYNLKDQTPLKTNRFQTKQYK